MHNQSDSSTTNLFLSPRYFATEYSIGSLFAERPIVVVIWIGDPKSIEELSLLKRVFGEQFILDPSGGIRELKDVAEYVRRGFTVIHSQKTFPFIEEFRVLKERGGHLNV